MSKRSNDPIDVSGKVYVSGNLLVDLRPSLSLPRGVAAGDIKLWCHLNQSGNSGAGQLRAAIYDGKSWRTFRLNVVAGEHARYSCFQEIDEKLAACVRCLKTVTGRSATYHEGTYGVTFTLPQAEPVAARVSTGEQTGRLDRPVSRGKSGEQAVQLKLF